MRSRGRRVACAALLEEERTVEAVSPVWAGHTRFRRAGSHVVYQGPWLWTKELSLADLSRKQGIWKGEGSHQKTASAEPGWGGQSPASP